MYEKIYPALFIFIAFFLASLIIARALRKASSHFDTSSSEVFSLLSGSQKAVLIIIGSVLALSEFGYDVSALVAALGLTGFCTKRCDIELSSRYNDRAIQTDRIRGYR